MFKLTQTAFIVSHTRTLCEHIVRILSDVRQICRFISMFTNWTYVVSILRWLV